MQLNSSSGRLFLRHRIILGVLCLFRTTEVCTGLLRFYFAQTGLFVVVNLPRFLSFGLVIATMLRARLTAQARPSSAPFMDMARWIGEYEALYREVRAHANAAARPQEGV